MKKINFIAILLFISLLLSSCYTSASNAGMTITPTPTETPVATETPTATQTPTETPTETPTATDAPAVDYSRYTGIWKTEENIKNNYDYGTGMGISVDKDGSAKGEIGSSTNNATHIANIDFSGKIEDSKLTYTFADDAWGNAGTISFIFSDDKIKVTITLTKKDETTLWGIQEGSYLFVKSSSDYTYQAK